MSRRSAISSGDGHTAGKFHTLYQASGSRKCTRVMLMCPVTPTLRFRPILSLCKTYEKPADVQHCHAFEMEAMK